MPHTSWSTWPLQGLGTRCHARPAASPAFRAAASGRACCPVDVVGGSGEAGVEHLASLRARAVAVTRVGALEQRPYADSSLSPKTCRSTRTLSKRKSVLERSSNAWSSRYCTGRLAKPMKRQSGVSQSAHTASNDWRTLGPSREDTKRWRSKAKSCRPTRVFSVQAGSVVSYSTKASRRSTRSWSAGPTDCFPQARSSSSCVKTRRPVARCRSAWSCARSIT